MTARRRARLQGRRALPAESAGRRAVVCCGCFSITTTIIRQSAAGCGSITPGSVILPHLIVRAADGAADADTTERGDRNQAMPIKLHMKAATVRLGMFAALMLAGVVHAQTLASTLQAEENINDTSAQSQVRVSSLARQTQDLLTEYRSVVREIESLKIYNDNLERIVVDQRNEVQSINRQLEGLEATNRGVVPLMLEMIDTLDRIVEADVPFRIEERRERVQRLRDMMDEAEVTASEKYRRVMEAYQSELEFGRTTEAYSAKLPGTEQTVDFLRVGRTLLVYQTSDSANTGWFNPRTREFEELDDDRFRLEVKNGLAIARNEKAPDLVMLPVPGPEAGE
jgi:hypothetical protein